MPYKDLEKLRVYKKRYMEEHPDMFKQAGIKYRLRLKKEALEAYGGCKCACCGEEEIKFLTLDHINNDGKEHRRNLKDRHHLSGAWFYLALKKEGYPPGLQVLCFNCNMGKQANGGVCPHATKG